MLEVRVLGLRARDARDPFVAVAERLEIVTSARATMTRPTTIARRMSALRAFEGYGVGFER
jgi:hypothetical protein